MIASLFLLGCSRTSSSAAQNPTSQSQASKAPQTDDAQASFDKLQQEARDNYVQDLRKEFDREGVYAAVMVDQRQLVFTSSDLESDEMKQLFIRKTFKPSMVRGLCGLGFRTYALKSGVFSGSRKDYSLGCTETPAEKQARLKEEQTERQSYASDLQHDLDSHDIHDMHFEEKQGELILAVQTSDSTHQEAQSLVKQGKQMMSSMIDATARRKMCGIGFTGIRITTSEPNLSAVDAFHCSHESASEKTGPS